ncbi:MAG: hypothetical protein US57_C0007G0012 [Candidatus Moranbacteria bacterium GW2011_GWC2_37_73]|nr:MAG: hypothetical protein UR95_C0004G0051 [Parcubacteria group bacterium GW2011_GWC1_36_108]KKQ00606.1 MAG: hypothetical protein US09_C0009G0027 [Candidatus Moranbacteria bacterium GW2011_GWD1_36_198]KKQ02011.1 MAG: hypothetical protein US10_C0006G0009 [Candidatus Moranbacteria bacterium GW2011_GWD2_36_198]KKQ39868.1 MAG: hypothetical protein US57_C0007G0012 [Candidatus Moranbacteria bacterium GW2011_GWC2_37_73]
MAQTKKVPKKSISAIIFALKGKLLTAIWTILTIRNLMIIICILTVTIGVHFFNKQLLTEKIKRVNDHVQKKKIAEAKKTMHRVLKSSLRGNTDTSLWLKTKMQFSINKELAVPDAEDSENFYFGAERFLEYYEYSIYDVYGSELLLRPPPKSNKPDSKESGLIFYLKKTLFNNNKFFFWRAAYWTNFRSFAQFQLTANLADKIFLLSKVLSSFNFT